MKAWIVQIGERLPVYNGIRKLRCTVLAEKLAEKGHIVYWWASAFDHFSKEWVETADIDIEIDKGLILKLLRGIGYRKNISIRRYIDHRIIAWKFRAEAKKVEKPDILIVSMPSHDIAYQAIRYAKRENIPTIVDIRDPWPDLFIENFPKNIRKLAKVLLLNDFRMIEYIMRNADSLVAVSNSFLEWGLSYTGREKTDKDLVLHLGYCKMPFYGDEKISERIKRLIKEIEDRFVVSYIGTFGKYNNPEILVDCARRMTEKRIAFVLAGSGDQFENIRKRASDLPNVYFPGWLDQLEIDTLLKHTKVGVCTTPIKIDLFPNKAFLYLSAGIPIISSFEGDLKDLIYNERIGYYYEPGDIETLLRCIDNLYCNEEEYNMMADNAKVQFDRKFNEEEIYREYVDHIESYMKPE